MSFVIAGALIAATVALLSLFYFAFRDPASRRSLMQDDEAASGARGPGESA